MGMCVGGGNHTCILMNKVEEHSTSMLPRGSLRLVRRLSANMKIEKKAFIIRLVTKDDIGKAAIMTPRHTKHTHPSCV